MTGAQVEPDPASSLMPSTPGNQDLAPSNEAGDAATGQAQGPIRLQKVLAAAGLGSRRACERLIVDGRVRVDGRVVEELGTRIDAQSAVVLVDGQRVVVSPGIVHLALNKPQGVLSAMSDDRGRPTVGDLVVDYPQRLFHVGRLDADTEGLLLLMNDGQLANFLMHPSGEVRKTYLADVSGAVARDVGRRLLAGIELEDGAASADAFRVVQRTSDRSLVEIVLHEGRNRIVRRMLEAVGHPVERLVRTAVGPVLLGGQRAGTIRTLSREEVSALYELMDIATKR